MKACILSMQRVNNMGSLLQAYGLRKILQELGHQVEFLDIEYNSSEKVLLENKENKYIDESENGKRRKRIDKYFFNRVMHHFSEKKQDVIFENFRKEELKIDECSSTYDVCVIGSDEVFNCMNSGAWGFTTQLFGNVTRAKRVITYAASCGATTISELPKKVSKSIENSFKNIHSFSVRDENTFQFVEELAHRKAEIHLDPVLVYDFHRELENVRVPKNLNRFCIIYSYRNRIHDKSEIMEIQRFCKINHLIPVSVGAPQFWTKEYIPCAPFECLRLFSEAECVITDTFHGTIFSAKYAKNFVVITRKSNENKLRDLVKRLKLENHLIDDFSKLNSRNLQENDRKRIFEKIEKEKQRTIIYLNGALTSL